MSILSNVFNSIVSYIKDNKIKTIVYLSSFLVGVLIGVIIGNTKIDYYDNYVNENYVNNLINQSASIVIFIKQNIIFFLFVFIGTFLVLICPILQTLIFSMYIALIIAKVISVGIVILFGGGIFGVFTFLLYFLVPSIILFAFLYITKLIFTQNYCKNSLLFKKILTEMIITYLILYLIYLLIICLYSIVISLVFKIIF